MSQSSQAMGCVTIETLPASPPLCPGVWNRPSMLGAGLFPAKPHVTVGSNPNKAQVLNHYLLLRLQDAPPQFCAERIKTECPIHLSGASSLLQTLEKTSTLIRTPTNMGVKKSRGGERGRGKNNPVSEVSLGGGAEGCTCSEDSLSS